jgi:hypothetical protein
MLSVNTGSAIYQALGNDTTPAGYLQGTLFALLGPLLLVMMAVTTGARAIAGDEEAGTLDLVLAQPGQPHPPGRRALRRLGRRRHPARDGHLGRHGGRGGRGRHGHRRGPPSPWSWSGWPCGGSTAATSPCEGTSLMRLDDPPVSGRLAAAIRQFIRTTAEPSA